MPKPFICKKCGFDLELSPRHDCVPVSEILELDALKAHVEQLRVALAATRQPHMDYIPTLGKTAQQVLDETPAQCLAEVRVQDRKNGFIAGYFHCRNNGFLFEDELKEASYKYANKIT